MIDCCAILFGVQNTCLGLEFLRENACVNTEECFKTVLHGRWPHNMHVEVRGQFAGGLVVPKIVRLGNCLYLQSHLAVPSAYFDHLSWCF